MRIFLLYSIIFVCGISQTSMAKVKSVTQLKEKQFSAARRTLSMSGTLRGVFTFYLAGGTSIEGMMGIIKDLKIDSEYIPPKASLNSKGEILIESQKSGLRITSFNPFNVKIKGRIWSYNKSETLEQNFYSLRRFHGSYAGYSRPPLIPMAEAKESPLMVAWAALIGVAAGASGGIVWGPYGIIAGGILGGLTFGSFAYALEYGVPDNNGRYLISDCKSKICEDHKRRYETVLKNVELVMARLEKPDKGVENPVPESRGISI